MGITPDYLVETVHILRLTWHNGIQTFTSRELEKMVGKLGHIGKGYGSIYHLMPILYASIAFGLLENKEFIYSTSKVYQTLIKKATLRPKNKEDTC